MVLQHNGGGDFGVFGAQILCGGTVPAGDGNGARPDRCVANVRGYTDWLAVPACGFQGGNISALTNAQYLQMQEFHISDNGNDVSAIGSVMGYARTSMTPPKLNNRWIDQLTTCNLLLPPGSIPCDAAHVIGGQWFIGIDFAGLPGVQQVTAPIAMMANQKMTLNSYNLDGEGNPSKTVLGGDWITDDGTGIVLAQNGSTSLRVVNNPGAVNYWQFTGSAAGNAVAISPAGSDSTIPVLIGDKGGAGVITLSNGSIATRVAAPAAANSYLNITAGTATTPVDDRRLRPFDPGHGAGRGGQWLGALGGHDAVRRRFEHGGGHDGVCPECGQIRGVRDDRQPLQDRSTSAPGQTSRYRCRLV